MPTSVCRNIFNFNISKKKKKKKPSQVSLSVSVSELQSDSYDFTPIPLPVCLAFLVVETKLNDVLPYYTLPAGVNSILLFTVDKMCLQYMLLTFFAQSQTCLVESSLIW